MVRWINDHFWGVRYMSYVVWYTTFDDMALCLLQILDLSSPPGRDPKAECALHDVAAAHCTPTALGQLMNSFAPSGAAIIVCSGWGVKSVGDDTNPSTEIIFPNLDGSKPGTPTPW